MQDELASVGVKMGECVFRCRDRAFGLDVNCQHVTQGRFAEQFLLAGIEAIDAEQRDVRLADQRRLTPEAH